MNSTYEQIQVLYEISLEIGQGNNLKTIARNALSVYLRKLNCSSGAILRKLTGKENRTYYEMLISIPIKIDKNKIFQQAINDVSLDDVEKITRKLAFPIIEQFDNETHYYIFNLPGFGIIILIKHGEKLASGTVSLLEPLNIKLAQSCIAELAKERDRLQTAALNNAANAIVITNAEGIIEWVNPSWSALTCYSSEDAVNNSTKILKSGYQDDEFYKEMWKTILSGNVWRGEIINKKKDGNLYLEETTITPIIDISGKITHFVGVNQDITERKDMEEKLRESEEKFRSIIENANDGIYLRDLDGVITFANEKFAKIHGYRLSEVIGRKSWEFLHPDDLEQLEENGELKKVQNGEFTEGEERGITKNGDIVYLDIRTAPLMIDLNIIGVFGIIRDITNRKQYEAKIRESEERFKSTANLLPQPIWETDLDGHYTYTNLSGYRQFGYTKADIKKGVFVNELIAPEDRKRAVENFIKTSRGIPFNDNEYICIKKDGSRFPALVYLSPIIKDGEQTGMRGITIDITDLKETQDKLQKSQERLLSINEELKIAKEVAESAEKAQSDFLSTMSHEIRTPMNAVVGLTNILITENPQAHQLANLKTLEFSSQNLLNIINDILNFNKLESGNVIFENIDFNIKQVLDGIYFAMKPLADEKNLRLNIKIDDAIPSGLVGDSTRLMQIINNLVSNCIKFTNEGCVTVNVKRLKNEDNDIRILFEVIDTGIGIKEDNIGKIFEAFKQAETATSRLYGGTGLGLPIVKKLLELQNSNIHVKSKFGKGSVFSFTLNYKKGKENAEKIELVKMQEEDLSLKGTKILIVEDNTINQIVLKQFLERWGCIYDIAENGVKAIEKVKNGEYQVILMDLQMPTMDGYTATSVIRNMEDEKRSKIPIIALSASALMEIKDKTKAVGMNDFITKPFVPRNLFNAIKNACLRNK